MPPATASARIDQLFLAHDLRNNQEHLGPVRDHPLKLLKLGIANGWAALYASAPATLGWGVQPLQG